MMLIRNDPQDPYRKVTDNLTPGENSPTRTPQLNGRAAANKAVDLRQQFGSLPVSSSKKPPFQVVFYTAFFDPDTNPI